MELFRGEIDPWPYAAANKTSNTIPDRKRLLLWKLVGNAFSAEDDMSVLPPLCLGNPAEAFRFDSAALASDIFGILDSDSTKINRGIDLDWSFIVHDSSLRTREINEIHDEVEKNYCFHMLPKPVNREIHSRCLYTSVLAFINPKTNDEATLEDTEESLKMSGTDGSQQPDAVADGLKEMAGILTAATDKADDMENEHCESDDFSMPFTMAQGVTEQCFDFTAEFEKAARVIYCRALQWYQSCSTGLELDNGQWSFLSVEFRNRLISAQREWRDSKVFWVVENILKLQNLAFALVHHSLPEAVSLYQTSNFLEDDQVCIGPALYLLNHSKRAEHPKLLLLRNCLATLSAILPGCKNLIISNYSSCLDVFKVAQSLTLNVFQVHDPNTIHRCQVNNFADCSLISAEDLLSSSQKCDLKQFHHVILFVSDSFTQQRIMDMIETQSLTIFSFKPSQTYLMEIFDHLDISMSTDPQGNSNDDEVPSGLQDDMHDCLQVDQYLDEVNPTMSLPQQYFSARKPTSFGIFNEFPILHYSKDSFQSLSGPHPTAEEVWNPTFSPRHSLLQEPCTYDLEYILRDRREGTTMDEKNNSASIGVNHWSAYQDPTLTSIPPNLEPNPFEPSAIMPPSYPPIQYQAQESFHEYEFAKSDMHDLSPLTGDLFGQTFDCSHHFSSEPCQPTEGPSLPGRKEPTAVPGSCRYEKEINPLEKLEHIYHSMKKKIIKKRTIRKEIKGKRFTTRRLKM